MLLEIIGNHEPANKSSVQKGSMAPFPVCIRVHLSMKKNGVWIQNWTSAHNRGGPLCYGVPVPALVILPNVGIPESPQNPEEICKRFWNSSAKWPEKTDPSSTPAFPGRLWSLYTFWMDTSDGSMVLLSVVKVPLGWWCSHGLGGSINRGTPSHHPFLFGIFPFKPSSFWVSPWLWKRPTKSFLAPPRWKM